MSSTPTASIASPVNAKERLILALDVPSIEDARAMVAALEGTVEFFKVGLTLQLAHGVEDFIRELIRAGKSVFLDYKYYDVPETLRKAVSRAAKLGVKFLTIHGSSEVMKAAAEAKGDSALKLFVVTVLTSMDTADMAEMGYTMHSPEQLVLFRAKKALEAGCDGVIASGLEAQAIKAIAGDKLLVTTPGIRQAGAPGDDQKRKATPAGAILAGSDYLVIGRPITQPQTGTPKEAAEAILKEMQAAFDQRGALN